MGFDGKRLAFFCRKFEPIDVAILLDNALCRGGGRRKGCGLLVGMVRFGFVGVVERMEDDPVRRWGGETIGLAKDREGTGGRFGERDGLFDGAAGVCEEGEFHGFARFGTGGKNGRRTWGDGDVKAVVAVVTALIGSFTHDDAIESVFWSDDCGKCIGAEERGIISGREFETFWIENGDVGIKHFLAEANGFHFRAEALALGELNGKKIFVFVFYNAVHSGIETDGLWGIEGIVGLDFRDGWELADEEDFHFGNTTFASNTELVLAQRAIGAHGGDCADVFAIMDSDGSKTDSWAVGKNLLGIMEAIAVEM